MNREDIIKESKRLSENLKCLKNLDSKCDDEIILKQIQSIRRSERERILRIITNCEKSENVNINYETLKKLINKPWLEK